MGQKPKPKQAKTPKTTKQAPSAKTAKPKGKQGKTNDAKLRQKKIAIGMVAGLIVLLMLSTLLAVPGVQNALFSGFGIDESIPEAQSVSFENPFGADAILIPDPEGSAETAPGEGRPAPDMTAAVHFLDVGQGDAVLIESEGEYALIDAGPAEGIDALMGYLSYLEIESLKYLVMSHPHEDHIGGMQTVVEYIPVEQVLLPDLEKAPYPTTSTFKNLLDAMLERELPTGTMKTGDIYPLGNGNLKVLADGLETEDNYNLLSPTLLFETGDLRYLSTGDAEKDNEQAVLDAGTDVEANLYKAAHHGSDTSNSAAFLSAVHPWLTVITCGEGNTYGHPHRDPIANFEAVGSGVLRTDLDGFIRVTPDGQGGLSASTTRQREDESQGQSQLPQAA